MPLPLRNPESSLACGSKSLTESSEFIWTVVVYPPTRNKAAVAAFASCSVPSKVANGGWGSFARISPCSAGPNCNWVGSSPRSLFLESSRSSNARLPPVFLLKDAVKAV